MALKGKWRSNIILIYLYKINKKGEIQMNLKLVTKKLFGELIIECYEDTKKDDGNFYMTRRQIGEALEYKTRSGYNNVLQRNKNEIGDPTVHNLSTVEGSRVITRNIELYTFHQLFQILRFSKQSKANLFMDWAATTLEELVTNRAELKFKNQISAEEYETKIAELKEKAEAYDKILIAPNSQHMNIIAKTLGVGRNKLFAFLRRQKILMDNNTPYQRFIKSNYFLVREQTIQTGEIVPVTYITGKGLDYIRKLLKKFDYEI